MARLITTATNESGAAVWFKFKMRGMYRPVQADISAAATVTIEGRAATDLAWVPLHEFTADGAENVLVMYEMRATVADNTGTVDVELDA